MGSLIPQLSHVLVGNCRPQRHVRARCPHRLAHTSARSDSRGNGTGLPPKSIAPSNGNPLESHPGVTSDGNRSNDECPAASGRSASPKGIFAMLVGKGRSGSASRNAARWRPVCSRSSLKSLRTPVEVRESRSYLGSLSRWELVVTGRTSNGLLSKT
jgi:hypothetical protein